MLARLEVQVRTECKYGWAVVPILADPILDCAVVLVVSTGRGSVDQVVAPTMTGAALRLLHACVVGGACQLPMLLHAHRAG
jgi:hypothetical protein